ncbi:hypothetical protein M405DRAFT_827868 [Rhizopogon salebrosus TDB-379]|nr:hypothetical protein M405DRAFT_827868 [Rhizopogon salebrosus TDB-379]
MSNPTEPSNDNSQLTALPDWWNAPKHPVLCMLFRSLCLISVSRSHLGDMWHSGISDLDSKHRKMIIDRLSNTNLVVKRIEMVAAAY